MELRPRSDIETGLAAAQFWLPDARDKDFVNGAIAAYRWVLGQEPAAPATGSVITPTAKAVVREEELARAAIYGQRSAPELRRTYAVGIENALMWCRGATDGAPVPLDLVA